MFNLLNFFKRPIANPDSKFTFVMTNDGNITLVRNNKTHSIGKDHQSYEAIRTILTSNGNERVLDVLIEPAKTVNRAFKGRVTVNEYGEVAYDGQPLHNTIATRITEFAKNGLSYKPLVAFLENLMENPNPRSVRELYTFLEHEGMPVTADGCFIAYKGVSANWKDKHTGTFDNQVGAINEMPRENVDPDCHVACSVGFHVGSYNYASNFGQGGHLVLVKVNPRDAVSVPLDHCAEKLRVCRYEVLSVCPGVLKSPVYVASNETMAMASDDDEVYDDSDYESDDDGDYDEDSDQAVCAVQTKTPKRAACDYCGAKGGKKHVRKCARPRKS